MKDVTSSQKKNKKQNFNSSIHHRSPTMMGFALAIHCAKLSLLFNCFSWKAYLYIFPLLSITFSLIYSEIKATDMKYRNRIRSRISNLKDPKNPNLRRNVLCGSVSSQRIAAMTAEVLGSYNTKYCTLFCGPYSIFIMSEGFTDIEHTHDFHSS